MQSNDQTSNSNSIQLLYEDEFLKMYFDASINSIVKQWKQNTSEDKFRLLIINLLMKIIELRQQHNVNINLLADCRALSGDFFSQPIIDWLNARIHKMYAANNIRKKAFLASHEVACNASISHYVSTSFQDGLEMRIFDDEQQARQWLIS